MEFIVKEDLIKNLAIMWDEMLGFKECVLLDDIMQMPAQKLVRCKECSKRYDRIKCPMCIVAYGEQYDLTHDNGFCDRGERKTE